MPASGSLVLRYPPVFAGHPEVAAAESTRHGGVSKPPFHSLNLSLHTEDQREAVLENRRRFFAACGFKPEQTAGSYQVHGTSIWRVDKPAYTKGYDALITDRPGILLTVTVADCTPILIYDPVQRAVGAIHAGWKGTAGEIARKTVEAMGAQFQTAPEHCLAYVGTCIDHCDFEVDADVADHFGDSYKQWDDARGKFFVDLKAANRAQLISTGIPKHNVQYSPFSTFTRHQDFFSHRYEKGKTGRMLAAIGLRF